MSHRHRRESSETRVSTRQYSVVRVETIIVHRSIDRSIRARGAPRGAARGAPAGAPPGGVQYYTPRAGDGEAPRCECERAQSLQRHKHLTERTYSQALTNCKRWPHMDKHTQHPIPARSSQYMPNLQCRTNRPKVWAHVLVSVLQLRMRALSSLLASWCSQTP